MEKILCIEPEQRRYDTLDAALQCALFDTIWARTREAGIATLTTQKRNVILVLLHHAPPSVEGYSTITGIREIDADVPIVAVGCVPQWYKNQCLTVGCTEFLAEFPSNEGLVNLASRYSKYI